MRDFEQAYFAVVMNQEYSVSGTDGHYAICYRGFNDWHVERDGVRDGKLTDIMKNVAGNDVFAYSAKRIADALRAQYELEKPKKFEFMTNSLQLYQTAFYSDKPYGLSVKHEIVEQVVKALGPLGTFKCKVTIEEIK